MSGRSGPGWGQGSDGHWYQPQQQSQANVPSSSPKTPQNPQIDGLKKNPRSFAERINTTQGIVTIVATLITLIFGGGGIALYIKHIASPAANSKALTVEQVRDALVTSADLAIIDQNLVTADKQVPARGSCKTTTVQAAIQLYREFTSPTSALAMTEEITIFHSSNDAHEAFLEYSKYDGLTCPSSPMPTSTSNISSQIGRLCEESNAWKSTETNGNVTGSAYNGMARCGAALVSFVLVTLQGSSFDDANNLANGMEISVAKLQELP
jgi:hypothetical protein